MSTFYQMPKPGDTIYREVPWEDASKNRIVITVESIEPTCQVARYSADHCGHVEVFPKAVATWFFFHADASILPWLHNAVLDNVVDDSTVGIDRSQDYPLRRPPRVGRALRLFPISRLRLWRHHGDGIEDGSQASQRPLFTQSGRQYPLALRLRLHVQPASLAVLARLSRAVGVLEQLDLLVGVGVKAVRRQAREQRARQQGVGDGRGRVLFEVRPVVLVVEVVLDLAGERVQTGQVRLRGSQLLVLDKSLERGGLHSRFHVLEPRHGQRAGARGLGVFRCGERVVARVGRSVDLLAR
jgi:hypothetical protein